MDIPKLWGDGEHDDADALQYYIDNNIPVPQNRTYKISKALNFAAPGEYRGLWNITIRGDDDGC